MHIDGNLVPLFALAVGLVITITAILTDTISKYKLKSQQIKADAMVRAEEVRARNQLELERLMRQDQGNGASNGAADNIGNKAGNSLGNTDAAVNSEDNFSGRSRVRE